MQERIIDPAQYAAQKPIADWEEIRRFIPQRYEMEQVTGILHEDIEANICVGFKEVSREEFWVRGHMPGMPLMPGVIMLESAAQLASYFVQKHDMLKTKMVGFGGVEQARFREPVIPGDRLIIALKLLKARPRRMMVCRFEGYVRDRLVVDGTLKGIPLPVDALGEQFRQPDEAKS